ncbi:MAG: hypothetical protein IPM26_01300 [Saprospiraceae bacterium]|nr:hypothetical protein [Saprospiraceae bacterium]
MKSHNYNCRIRSVLLIIHLAALQQMSAFTQVNQNPGTNQLTVKAISTGKTTGHIATLTIINHSDKTVLFDGGAYFIPSSGHAQPYASPQIPKTEVVGKSSIQVPIHGYCADIRRPPVPADSELPPFSQWIKVLPVDPLWKPDPSFGWVKNTGLNPQPVVTIPGTDRPINHTIDMDRYPVAAGTVLVDAVRRLEEVYDSLHQTGIIKTPFASNYEKEKETVIQHSFWIFSAGLTGHPYTKEEFSDKTTEQFEKQTGQKLFVLPEVAKETLMKGIDDFWESFQLTGAEAKIIPTKPNNKPSDHNPASNPLGENVKDIKPHSDKPDVTDKLAAEAKAKGQQIEIKSQSGKDEMVHEAAHVTQQTSGKKEGESADTAGDKKDAKPKPRCKCINITGKVKTSRSLSEYSFEVNPDSQSPTVIKDPNVSFDKPADVRKPVEFTVTLSELKLECTCDDGKCEQLSSKKGKSDNKYGFSVTQYTTGLELDGDSKKTGDTSQDFNFKSKSVASKDIVINFKISAYCGSDACSQSFCSATIRLSLKMMTQ